MIVFIEDINLIKYFNKYVVFNLSSYYSGYNDITNLILMANQCNNTAIHITEYINMPEFDINYMNCIFNDSALFNSFISILHCAVNGYTAIVLVKHDFYRDAIMESIIKLIQQRYGYQCWVIESVDDIDCLSESRFTPYGLMMLDEDLKRFNYSEKILDIYEVTP